MESRAAKTIREVFESGRPLTYIRSSEEQRIGRVLREVAAGPFGSEPLPVWTWSLTEGMIRDGASLARRLGLEVHAGHWLDFETAEAIAALPEIVELNIGHFLVGEAVFFGLTDTIRTMRATGAT